MAFTKMAWHRGSKSPKSSAPASLGGDRNSEWQRNEASSADPDGFDRADPYLFPLRAADLSGLPATLIITAEFDPLRDEGRAYAERLRAAGVAVEHLHLDDQMHGFLLQETTVDRAREAVDHFADALRRGLA